MRLKEETDELVKLEILFTTYQFESVEFFGKKDPISIEWFSKYLQSVFRHVQIVRKTEQKIRYVKGLSLQDHQKDENAIDFFSIPKYVTPGTVSNVTSENEISCVIKTPYRCNNHVINKSISFHRNGLWELECANKKIDLSSLSIYPRYICSKMGIETILKITNKLKMCEGVKLSTLKSVACSRFQTIEKFEHSTNDEEKENYSTSRIIRSTLCSRFIPVTSRSNKCRNCQKMTLSDKKNMQTLNEKLEKKDSVHQPVTVLDIKTLLPSASESMITLLLSQLKNAGRNPKGRRWPNEIISLCLDLYNRSPKSYECLQKSNMLVLPSTNLLILYKNCVRQKVGFHDEMFEWMYNEATRLQVPKEGFVGGIILDEMSIQEDLQIEKNRDGVELIGFVDKGEESNCCATLRAGTSEKKLGNHVLQFVFLGLTGFRFPFAHFISDQLQGYDIHILFWEAVDRLQMFGFLCSFTSMDGAANNRSFMNINVADKNSRMVKNPCNFEEKVAFLMDYSHVVKKIRNNILASGIKKGCTRNLKLVSGELIQWQMFQDCYNWDKKNAIQIHKRLTNEHLYPSQQTKMRNQLAEEVLDEEMLHLFLEYQSTLGGNGVILNGPIKLLQQTSKLVRIFRDRLPVMSLDDKRLKDLQHVLSWFQEWREGIKRESSPNSCLMSYQCMDDIESCIIGFLELCSGMLGRVDLDILITPAMINSDIVENIFCQQRATYNGANSNPNALQYQKTLNSVILGQSSISKKANSSKSGERTLSLILNKPKSIKRQKTEPHEDKPTVQFKVIRL